MNTVGSIRKWFVCIAHAIRESYLSPLKRRLDNWYFFEEMARSIICPSIVNQMILYACPLSRLLWFWKLQHKITAASCCGTETNLGELSCPYCATKLDTACWKLWSFIGKKARGFKLLITTLLTMPVKFLIACEPLYRGATSLFLPGNPPIYIFL